MTLSDSEKKRYFRQLSVWGWDQEKLKSAKVFIAGLGGLGSASSFYLAAAGVGKLCICDGDRVERSDLNRQILYSESSLGKFKVEEAEKRLSSLNPTIVIETVGDFFDDSNIGEILGGSNLIVDGLDNSESRFILNRQAIKKGIPYVYGAVQGWEGYVSLFYPPHTACLACFMPQRTNRPDVIPVAGVLPGTIGLLQATEAIKFIMGVEMVLFNRLLIYDSRNLRFDFVDLEKNPDCSFCAA
ncbi:ThiF family adenylyltransferase [Acidobacteriota bacterium]